MAFLFLQGFLLSFGSVPPGRLCKGAFRRASFFISRQQCTLALAASVRRSLPRSRLVVFPAAMALLLRTAVEVYDRKRQIALLLLLAALLAQGGHGQAASMMVQVVLGGSKMLFGPGRDWSKGVLRTPNWNLDMYSEHQCWEQLRWRKQDIPQLAQDLGLPPVFKTSRRYVFTREEATVVLLRRFAHAGSWESILQFLGGRCRTAYVTLFNEMLQYLWDAFSDRLTDISRWANEADTWADAIHAAGAPAPRCISFVDGTLRSCARPGENQEELYSGYKKQHGVKFQTCVAPNGLISDFFGPICGRRGDGYMLRKSRLEDRIARLCLRAGAPYYVYGDPAYPLTQYIMRGFKGPMSAFQRAFSKAMSSERETVEWGYALVTANWKLLEGTWSLKFGKSPIGLMYAVGVLLTNLHTCEYGNQILTHFLATYPHESLKPPSVHDYLHK